MYVLQTMCAKLGKVDVQTKVFTTQDVNIPDVVIVNDEPSDVMKSTIWQDAAALAFSIEYFWPELNLTNVPKH